MSYFTDFNGGMFDSVSISDTTGRTGKNSRGALASAAIC